MPKKNTKTTEIINTNKDYNNIEPDKLKDNNYQESIMKAIKSSKESIKVPEEDKIAEIAKSLKKHGFAISEGNKFAGNASLPINKGQSNSQIR